MFCERCGKQLDDTLKFCNGCGAQIKKDKDEPMSILSSMVTALIVIGTAGLGILVGLSAVLLDKIPTFEAVLIFGVFYLAAWFGVCFMIMRQISKLIDANLEARKSPVDAKPLVQLPPRSTNQLEEFRTPASVIDHTTRTLDKVPLASREHPSADWQPRSCGF